MTKSILTEKFQSIYKTNTWGSKESVSGEGSELYSTETIRKYLPFIFKNWEIKSMLDIPCGDFNWMKEVDLTEINYHGADIVPEIIDNNKQKYSEIQFSTLDIVNDILPTADLVFVRDCLVHLSNENIIRSLRNIKSSGSKYLLTTSFPRWNHNRDITDGDWRPINLMMEPFGLTPQYLINEQCQEQYPMYKDKCMILFDMNNL
jgi:hypothetical protein